MQIDAAAYLGVLIFVNLFYLALMILLTWIVVYVYRRQSLGPDNSLSRQIQHRVFFSSFIFLQLTLLCKLIVAVIMLLHVCSLTHSGLPILTIRLFYHASSLFLCIAYFIELYQWLFIAMRVDLYGGKFGVRVFRKRVQKSQRTSSISSIVVFGATFILILAEVFTRLDQVSQAVSMMGVLEYLALLLCYIITGSLIIRNLWVYFDKNYNQQRYSLLAALLLTIVSLVVLSCRFVLEFVYSSQLMQIGESKDSEKTMISITACLLIILISDLLPIVSQMLCIWIADKGRWDNLMSGFLHKPVEEDSTYAGSEMLEGLRKELYPTCQDTLVFSTPDDSFAHSFDSDWKSVLDMVPNNICLQSSSRS